MTRKAVLSGSGWGGEKRPGYGTSLAAYFIALPHFPKNDMTSGLF